MRVSLSARNRVVYFVRLDRRVTNIVAILLWPSRFVSIFVHLSVKLPNKNQGINPLLSNGKTKRKNSISTQTRIHIVPLCILRMKVDFLGKIRLDKVDLVGRTERS